MKTSWFNLLFASALVASMGSQTLAVGPTSTLYVTNYGEFAGGTVTGLDLIQGAGAASYPTSTPLGIAIAVFGDVRTMGYSGANQGERFDLAANPLVGGPYTKQYRQLAAP